MNHRRGVALGLLVLVAATPVLAGVSAEGILAQAGPSYCDVSYIVNNPCTGQSIWLYTSQDLGPVLCEYVNVSGEEVISTEGCVGMSLESGSFTTPSCPVQVPNLRLRFNSFGALILQWSPIACTQSHDLVRGSLDQLSEGHLGAVTCVGENVTGQGTTLHGDPNPLPGEAFFYLVRATGGVWGFQYYGYTSGGDRRSPQSGDCVY